MNKRERRHQYFCQLKQFHGKERYLFGLREFGIIFLPMLLLLIIIPMTIVLIAESYQRYAVTSFSFGAPVILLIIQGLFFYLVVSCYINCHSDSYIDKQIEETKPKEE